MTVTGIQGDLYYINNPILISITNISPILNYIDLQVSNINDTGNIITSNVLRIYPNTLNQIIDLDLSEIIKANFPRPQHPNELLANGTPIKTNYVRFSLTMQERLKNGNSGSVFAISKTYLRGGKDTQAVNVTTNVGALLSETGKILIWGGLPVLKYYIDGNKKIAFTGLVASSEVEQMRLVGCDPFYVRFLNSLGGYDFWYFPVWEEEKKTKSSGYIDRRRVINSFSLGFESNHIVKAESKIRREHYKIAKAMITSPEIHVYNKFGSTWSRIDINSESFTDSNYEEVSDFKVTFNVKLSNDARLIW